MKELLASPVPGILLTLGSYLLGKALYKKTNTPLLHPVVTAAAIILAVISLTPFTAGDYQRGGSMISLLLGPATVALAVPLYRRRALLKSHWAVILGAVGVGSMTSLGTVLMLGKILGLPRELLISLLPKSITTPMAVELVGPAGGLPSLTAVAVILTGIIGAMVGPPVLRFLKIRHPVARGLAMGTASHAIGTSRALEMGEEEGAISGLAIGLAGMVTVLLFPVFLLLV